MNQEIKLYLTEYGYLDLDNERNKSFGIPLVFQASDVSDITKRKSNFSKSIKVPGTPNNNIIFKQAYEITKYGGFNATTKHPCILMVDSNPIIQRYMLLNGISKLQVGEGYQIEYSVNIYDEVNNFFSDLKQKKLKELSFASSFNFTSYKGNQTITKNYDQGDHIFNESNAINAYQSNVYKYPIINYNYNDLFYRSPNYSYPYMGTSLGFLYPAVHIKAIWDKIFYDNGYTYNSTFLNDYTGTTSSLVTENVSGVFHRLLNIYNGDEKLTNKVYANLKLTNWTKPTDYNYIFYMPFGNGRQKVGLSPSILTVEPTYHQQSSEVYDSLLKYTNTYGDNAKECIIVIPEDGDYKVDLYFDIDIDQGGTTSGTTWTHTSGLTTYDIRVENNITRRNQVGGQYSFQWTEAKCLVSGNPYVAPVGDYEDASLNIHLTSQQMGFTRYNQAATTDTGYIFETGYTFKGIKDDVLYVQVNIGKILKDRGILDDYECTAGYKVNYFKIKLSENIIDEKFVNLHNTGITLSNYLPDMTQQDFIKNIMTMFNLYIRYDKYNNKLLHIEPFDTFYSQGTIQDWSSKVDYSDKIDISTLTDKLKNQYIYKYKDGDDLYSTKFIDQHGYNYGTKIINLNNQYLSDEQKSENKYQAFQSYNVITYFTTKLISGVTYTGTTYVSIPMLTDDLFSTVASQKKTTAPLIGIYNANAFTYNNGYYGNYLDLLHYNLWDNYYIYLFQEVSMLSPKTKYFKLNPDDTFYTYNSTDAFSLEYSADYGVSLLTSYPYPSVIYPLGIDYLYPIYHQNQLQNIIDQDAREVEFMMNLGINDIVKLDFRNKIFIDGQNYLLQKINFDPTATNKPSKVLLLKEI